MVRVKLIFPGLEMSEHSTEEVVPDCLEQKEVVAAKADRVGQN